MSELFFTPLPHRALIALEGADRVAFLQGLISADVTRAAPDLALYGAFLTPQGKFLYDLFLLAEGDRLWLEVERAGRDDFIARLKRFRLRAQVTLTANDDRQVFTVIGSGAAAAFAVAPAKGAATAWQGGLILVDPRLAAAGLRAWLPPMALPALAERGVVAAAAGAWDRQRIALGLPDGSRDLVPEKTILLEAGFDELSGVDWQKGCFLGQEVTARSKYRGQIKKRLLPVRIDGPPPPPGTPVFLGAPATGEIAGETRSQSGDLALAMLRLDSLAQLQGGAVSLTAGEARLVPVPPDWFGIS